MGHGTDKYFLKNEAEENYRTIRAGGTGFYEQKRGLIAVWGKEAVQFLDGLISNDVKKLEDGGQMLAAFPNAQGRLLAVVRVLRQGDRFLFETEGATREKVFNNLFRFTFAGDFFVEDLSDNYSYFEIFGGEVSEPGAVATGFLYNSASSTDRFAENEIAEGFRADLIAAGAVEISDELHDILRIERGIPKYGIDMDETTIVPELGIDGLISYNKGCYIGQEIIARIHFRGHVAKRLTGLVFLDEEKRSGGEEEMSDQRAETRPAGSVFSDMTGTEITTSDGKNAGRITSVTFSPQLNATIALAYVRYDFLAEGTELRASEVTAVVKNLPFVI